MEIERKYLVKKVPSDLSVCKKHEISQGYLCTDPVVRIRRSGEEYYMTYKGKGLLAREEYNLPLTKEAYEHLSKKIDGILIQKTRYEIPLENGLIAELDLFEGELFPLQYVEVEFPSFEASRQFAPPEWFGQEVTSHPEYQNSSLSRHGLNGLFFSN